MNTKNVDLLDIPVPTKKGNEELRGGQTRLTTAALELLVRFDGKASLAEVVDQAVGLSGDEVYETAQVLARDGYIDVAGREKTLNLRMADVFGDKPGALAASANLKQEEEAETGAEALGHEGYYVSIARKAAERRTPGSGSSYSVLVIEDDEGLKRALNLLLTLHQFEPRLATTRSEILAALSVLPLPDLILLDVNLPDANGFDILAKLRHHPRLRAIPVIMLTAQTRREDVLRGITGRANGYITKPFENEILITAIKTVLGVH
ncbi:MAG: response regulator [Burkholderiales bacterium]